MSRFGTRSIISEEMKKDRDCIFEFVIFTRILDSNLIKSRIVFDFSSNTIELL